MKKLIVAFWITVASVMLPVSAFAEASAVVTSATTAATAISTDGVAVVAAIGGAMLAMAGVAILFKWAKAAIFG